MSLSPTRYQFAISARLPRRANTIADRGRKLPVEPRAAWPRMIAGSRVAQQLGAGRGHRAAGQADGSALRQRRAHGRGRARQRLAWRDAAASAGGWPTHRQTAVDLSSLLSDGRTHHGVVRRHRALVLRFTRGRSGRGLAAWGEHDLDQQLRHPLRGRRRWAHRAHGGSDHRFVVARRWSSSRRPRRTRSWPIRSVV